MSLRKLVRLNRFNTSPQDRVKEILKVRSDYQEIHDIVWKYFPDDQRFWQKEGNNVEQEQEPDFFDTPESLYITGRIKLFRKSIISNTSFIADSFLIDPITLKDCPRFRIHPLGCLRWSKINDEIDEFLENA